MARRLFEDSRSVTHHYPIHYGNDIKNDQYDQSTCVGEKLLRVFETISEIIREIHTTSLEKIPEARA
jgi:hypothetical protein